MRRMGTLTLAVAAVDFPDAMDRFHQLKAALSWHLNENFTAKLSYVYERYSATNFAMDDMQPFMESVDGGARRSVFLAATQPDYDAHFIGLSLAMKF